MIRKLSVLSLYTFMAIGGFLGCERDVFTQDTPQVAGLWMNEDGDSAIFVNQDSARAYAVEIELDDADDVIGASRDIDPVGRLVKQRIRKLGDACCKYSMTLSSKFVDSFEDDDAHLDSVVVFVKSYWSMKITLMFENGDVDTIVYRRADSDIESLLEISDSNTFQFKK